MDFAQLFNAFSTLRVGVIGDMMLDTYCWGHVDRISPEAPVPVVSLDRKEYRIGGAGNVALNAAALGASVSAFSVIGDDDDGVILQALLNSKGIDATNLLQSDERVTTNKTRIISRNQQMIRLDAEITSDLAAADESELLDRIEKYLVDTKPQVVIFEDYNKGVLTDTLISTVIDWCRQNNVITAVDPKRKNFFSYRGADIFKPNLKEVKEALNLLVEQVNDATLREIHHRLRAKLDHHVSFITLSEKGVFCQDDTNAMIIPSHFRNISDVSGAGDTVIATASLVYAATKDTNLMAQIANIAGGLVCEEVGTAPVNKERLRRECELLLR